MMVIHEPSCPTKRASQFCGEDDWIPWVNNDKTLQIFRWRNPKIRVFFWLVFPFKHVSVSIVSSCIYVYTSCLTWNHPSPFINSSPVNGVSIDPFDSTTGFEGNARFDTSGFSLSFCGVKNLAIFGSHRFLGHIKKNLSNYDKIPWNPVCFIGISKMELQYMIYSLLHSKGRWCSNIPVLNSTTTAFFHCSMKY